MKEKEQMELVNLIIKELTNQKVISKKTTAVDNTEKILKEYNKLKKSMLKLKQQIKSLEEEQKAMNPTTSKTNKVALKDKDQTYYYTDETLNNRISELKQEVIKTEKYIEYIDSVLEEFEENEYYPIIEEFYFNEKSQAEIAEFYDWATGTVSVRKKELLEQMSVMFFPNQFIKELTKWVKMDYKSCYSLI